MAFGSSGVNSSWTFSEYSGAGNNRLTLVPIQGTNTKIALDDIIVSAPAATIVRFFFRKTDGTLRKIHELRLVANGNLQASLHFGGAIISAAGEEFMAQVQGDAIYLTTIYETTT